MFKIEMLCNYNNKQTNKQKNMCSNSSQKEFYEKTKIFES